MMPTIRDVAREAGVSVSTVSLVINGRQSIKLETRFRVLKAIEALRYVPNQAARALVTKKKKVIGLINTTCADKDFLYTFDSVPNTYLNDMLEAIVQETNALDYSITLDSTGAAGINFDKPPIIMDKNRVDGIMFMSGVLRDDQVQMLLELEIPTVVIGARSRYLDYVDTDPEKGFYLGTKHLLDNGHRQIACINGPIESQSSARKLKGYKAALKEAGVPFQEALCRRGNYSARTGYEAMQSIWAQGGMYPTALIALDCTALGAARYLYEQGLSCPKDISIVGFEDGLLPELSIPPMTSVRVHKALLGQQACRVLFNRLENPNAQKVQLILEPELILRASVRNLGG
jgi:DNA-binding LacI/PurR family transcriptional regulator